MAQTLAQSFYLGPFAVYTSPSGMTDPITGVPYLGGTLHEGDYVDLTREEAAQWNIRFGSQLNTGRYRLVRLSPNATAANIGFGKPVSWGLPMTVGQVSLAAAGTGATSNGTFTISSTTSGGTSVATALATVASGVITAVQLTFAGANFTSVPTFGLTEIPGLTGGNVLAQMAVSPNFISSFDAASSMQLSSPRGVALTAITAAQVTANAWIVIQEQGVAPVLVNTVTGGSAAGSGANAATGGQVATTAIASSPAAGFLGTTLDLSATNTIARVSLDLPVTQG